MFQGKRTSFSGVEHEKFSSSFSPPLLPPTAPHHRYQSHWHGMGGGGGANPPKTPLASQKKTYARRHKKNPLSIQIGRQHPLLLQLL